MIKNMSLILLSFFFLSTVTFFATSSHTIYLPNEDGYLLSPPMVDCAISSRHVSQPGTHHTPKGSLIEIHFTWQGDNPQFIDIQDGPKKVIKRSK